MSINTLNNEENTGNAKSEWDSVADMADEFGANASYENGSGDEFVDPGEAPKDPGDGWPGSPDENPSEPGDGWTPEGVTEDPGNK